MSRARSSAPAELEVEGLRNGDARALLASAVPSKLDERVRDRIIAETRGNPLALLELPRGLTATAAGRRVRDARSAGAAGSDRGELRPAARGASGGRAALLLVAAAEPVGDPLLLRRASERLGIDGLGAVDATDAAAGRRRASDLPPSAGALGGLPVRGGAPERRAAHLALAEVTDRSADPDRRAWHLAAAAAGPDEDVALELERSAGRAQARGGLAAAAAFLQRAVALTQDPGAAGGLARSPPPRRAFQAGAFDAALRLVGDRGRRRRSTSFSVPGWTCCAPRSPSPRALAAMPRPCS